MDQQGTRSPEAGRDDEARERSRENKEVYDEPWARLRIEEEGRKIAEFETAPPLSAETLELGKQLMIQKADVETINFARIWFENNRNVLEGKGYVVPTDPSDSYIVRIVKEAGGFEELRTNPDYSGDNRRIEGAYALRADLANGANSIESQTILLRELGQVQANKEPFVAIIDSKIERAEKKRPPDKVQLRQLTAEKAVLEAELGQLDKSIREIYACLNGKTPEEVVQGSHKQMAKSDYVTAELADLHERLKKEPNNLAGWTQAASRLGYRIVEDKKWWGGGFIVVDAHGAEERFGFGKVDNVGKFLHKIEIDRATKREEAIWEADNERIKKEAKEELREWEEAPDRATGGVEAIYNRVRERLITEHIIETRKRDPKSKEQLAAIKQEFQGEGLNAAEFIDTVVARKGGLADLSGRWESDQAAVKEFAESWGVPVGSREWEEFAKKQKGVYERRVKTRRGFIDWMIDMVLSTSDVKKDDTKPKKGGQPGSAPRSGSAAGNAGTASGVAGQGQQHMRVPRPVTARATRRPVTGGSSGTGPAPSPQQS